MLIKSADSKQSRLNLLADLQNSPAQNTRQKEWSQRARLKLQAGIKGEQDAAYYIDSHLGDSSNSAVIHDLRLSVDDNIAQIDHLVIWRALHFFMLETKNYNGSLAINPMGEFSVSYESGKTWGIESPIEQNHRHEVVLAKLLKRLGIPSRRWVAKPQFHHVVLVHPKAIIHRPDKAQFDTSNIMKADRFSTWYQQYIQQLSGLKMLSAWANGYSNNQLREIAEKIACQHCPSDPLALPDFMRPQPPLPRTGQRPSQDGSPRNAVTVDKTSTDISGNCLVCVKCGDRVTPAVVKFCSDHAERFKGLLYCISCQENISLQPSLPPTKQPPPQKFIPEKLANVQQASTDVPEKRLICAKCGNKISFPEGKFCWNNVDRFRGLQYCRTCQVEL